MFTSLLDALLLLTIATPGIGMLASRMGWKGLVEAHTLLGFTATIPLLHSLYTQVSAQGAVGVFLGDLSCGIGGVYMVVDDLSVFMILVYTLIGFTAAAYSVKYMERDTGLHGYYTLLLGITSGMVGVAIAGDLLTLYIFWEVMCLCSYALVAFRMGDWEPVEAGYKYLMMSGAGSITTLFAIALLYGMTGTLNLALLSQALAGSAGEPWMYLILTMMIAGLGLQAGMAPLHTWLPDAHSAAPSPISAILSGAMVMTGVYALLRVLIIIFIPHAGAWQTTLTLFSVATMLTGNLMALLQDDVKRLLAFSTVANVGYILLGLSTNSPLGFRGSLFHILNHALVKALLFLCSGSFLRQAGTRSLKELAGIGFSMPATSALFVLGLVSLAGIPPLNMFWSEWNILMAGLQEGMILFSLLMVINMVLSAAYSLRVIQGILVKGEAKAPRDASDPSISILLPKLALATLCILIGIYPGPFQTLAGEASEAALNTQAYIDAFLG